MRENGNYQHTTYHVDVESFIGLTRGAVEVPDNLGATYIVVDSIRESVDN